MENIDGTEPKIFFLPLFYQEHPRFTSDGEVSYDCPSSNHRQPDMCLFNPSAGSHHRLHIHEFWALEAASSPNGQRFAISGLQGLYVTDGQGHSSHKEIDRLNARAQHLRVQRGELGPDELPLTSVHYGLRQGDRVAFIAQHRPDGEPRVENGTRGQVTNIDQEGTLTLALDGSDRRLQLARQDAESLRLAYAQHVYRQQGATVDRAVVLTGGWQTSKETAYVQATRARKGTDWYLARDQLGQEGQDPDRITRLAGRMNRNRAHTPSVTHREAPGPSWDPSRDPLRLDRLITHVGKLLRTPAHDAPDRDIGRGR